MKPGSRRSNNEWTPKCFYTSRNGKDAFVDNLPLLDNFHAKASPDAQIHSNCGNQYRHGPGDFRRTGTCSSTKGLHESTAIA